MKTTQLQSENDFDGLKFEVVDMNVTGVSTVTYTDTKFAHYCHCPALKSKKKRVRNHMSNY